MTVGDEVYTPNNEGYQPGVSGVRLEKGKRGYKLFWPRQTASWHPNEGLATVVALGLGTVTVQKQDGTILRTEATHRVLCDKEVR